MDSARIAYDVQRNKLPADVARGRIVVPNTPVSLHIESMIYFLSQAMRHHLGWIRQSDTYSCGPDSSSDLTGPRYYAISSCIELPHAKRHG